MQRATFLYINVAPQWGELNTKNWEVIESMIRHYSFTKRLNMMVWTGTIGELQLMDSQNTAKSIFLNYVKDDPKTNPKTVGVKRIRVPKYFYKVLMVVKRGPKKDERQGVVFIGKYNQLFEIYLCPPDTIIIILF